MQSPTRFSMSAVFSSFRLFPVGVLSLSLLVTVGSSGCGPGPLNQLTASTLDLRVVPFLGEDGETRIALTHMDPGVVSAFYGTLRLNGVPVDIQQNCSSSVFGCGNPTGWVTSAMLADEGGTNTITLDFESGDVAVFEFGDVNATRRFVLEDTGPFTVGQVVTASWRPSSDEIEEPDTNFNENTRGLVDLVGPDHQFTVVPEYDGSEIVFTIPQGTPPGDYAMKKSDFSVETVRCSTANCYIATYLIPTEPVSVVVVE